MPNIPDYTTDGKVELGFGLSDQVDDWHSIGYVDEYAPVQLECHVYDGPHGHGFTVFSRVKINDAVWQNKMHIGPEDYRDDGNFEWKRYFESTELAETVNADIDLDERLWTDMLSNDPTRMEAAAGKIEPREKRGYTDRLLPIISDPGAEVAQRIAAGDLLGILGDPRFLDQDGQVRREPKLIEIPAGPFKMGSDDGHDNEKPVHEVYVSAFDIAKYPVTNIQYKAFLDANADRDAPEDWNDRTYPAGKANHPVVSVSWDDAQAYADWLSKATGKLYRLPTEAEWEKAARGNQDTQDYPWGDKFDSAKCNTEESGISGTTPVGIYPNGASPHGVLDMSGNVLEWCADWYDEAYYKKSPGRDPKGSEEGEYRVLRGGAWNFDRLVARCSFRNYFDPDLRLSLVGFRLSRTVNP